MCNETVILTTDNRDQLNQWLDIKLGLGYDVQQLYVVVSRQIHPDSTFGNQGYDVDRIVSPNKPADDDIWQMRAEQADGVSARLDLAEA